MNSIVIIDKEHKWRDFLSEELSGDYHINFCTTKKEISRKLKNIHFDVVLLDILGGDVRLLDTMKDIKKQSPFTPVVVTSSADSVDVVVLAMQRGAFDFVKKPYTSTKIKVALEKALENVSLKNEIDYLRREQDVIYDLDKIIAKSAAMKRVIEDVKKFARTDSTILLTGETGTGKSFLSGAIHYNSLRRSKPFVTINCANIQETLLESELFGHEKGAFTGADKLRVGRFEQANGGTIFLDEIGEMGMSLQAKLLRVIEDKAFERVGGSRTIFSNVRIVAATNKDLDSLVADGRFREDLFYRINVLPIRLPALRERRECLVLLAHFLLEKLGRAMHKNITGFSPNVLTAIKNYDWPGNIRQLANSIERVLLLEENEIVSSGNFLLPGEIREGARDSSSRKKSQGDLSLKSSEKENIIAALEKSLWIQKDAATLLGVSPRVLNHKIKKLGITHERWRKNR